MMRPTLILLLATTPCVSSCLGKRFGQEAQLQSVVVTAKMEPSPRGLHTAQWVGDGVLVWGGMLEDKMTPPATGGAIYYPESGKWYRLPKHKQETRYHHTAVWTGIQLILWGGVEGNFGDRTNAGYMFDNEDDQWFAVTTEGSPSARSGHSGVWTGDRMLIWGGENAEGVLGDGGAYDLVEDKWEALPSDDAPEARAFPSTSWGANKMIVWGGFNAAGPLNSGAIYDPKAKKWTPMSTKGAPKARFGHTAVWTGIKLIVWGGRASDDKYYNDGGVYDLKKDKWTPIAKEEELAPRELHSATWTGKEMVIIGGQDQNGPLNTHGVYDPKAKSWRHFALDPKYPARYMHSATWTGKNLLIHGGRTSGGRFLTQYQTVVVSLKPGVKPRVVKPSETVGNE